MHTISKLLQDFYELYQLKLEENPNYYLPGCENGKYNYDYRHNRAIRSAGIGKLIFMKNAESIEELVWEYPIEKICMDTEKAKKGWFDRISVVNEISGYDLSLDSLMIYTDTGHIYFYDTNKAVDSRQYSCDAISMIYRGYDSEVYFILGGWFSQSITKGTICVAVESSELPRLQRINYELIIEK